MTTILKAIFATGAICTTCGMNYEMRPVVCCTNCRGTSYRKANDFDNLLAHELAEILHSMEERICSLEDERNDN